MALNAYVESANTLREIAILDPSNRAGEMTRVRRDEILKQLRMQVENGRKLFVFANTNAGKLITLRIKRYLFQCFSQWTLSCRQSGRCRNVFHVSRGKKKIRDRSYSQKELWKSVRKPVRRSGRKSGWRCRRSAGRKWQLQESAPQAARRDSRRRFKPGSSFSVFQLSESGSLRQELSWAHQEAKSW